MIRIFLGGKLLPLKYPRYNPAMPVAFASQMFFSLLVFDDTAATPVDKPFHAVFPMDVAQVRVSHMR